MQCGEKDPFVDDTVIFAGRVREAKRTRKAELDLLLAGKSARFGEGMRMTAADGSGLIDGSRNTLKRERDQLAREGEEDWVQMVLFSDWSHGYLQMGSLMREARAVIELGDWIDDAFDRYAGNGINETTGVGAGAGDVGISTGPGTGGRRWTGTVGKGSEGASSLASETEETDDGSVITFVARKRAPSPKPEEAVRTETDVGRTADGTWSGSNGTAAQEEQRGPGEEVPGGKAVGRGGQTISETEMIRRRRLVDWHVFD
jgi:hypothetical protein